MSGLRVLLTGAAGFIGSHVAERLVRDGHAVLGVDNFDPFYPAEVKRANLAGLAGSPSFTLLEADILDSGRVWPAVDEFGGVDVVVHLAALAGVRPSLQRPARYMEVNVTGTAALLEGARQRGVKPFVFGSSSSVYGNDSPVPFRESAPASAPISPYAASKRAAELLCHSYAHLYGMSLVCLRFFTVYGPRQRPDLAIHKFTRLMSEGAPIPVYGDGGAERDYTYVDDIVQGVVAAVEYAVAAGSAFEVVNLGESQTTTLAELVRLIAESLDVQPTIERLPAQPGDVERTFADVSRARELLGYRPTTPVPEGIRRFVAWFRQQPAG
jgi:UDP-glucuronate 4-epimerase